MRLYMKRLTRLQAKLLETINLNPDKPLINIRKLINRGDTQLGSDKRIVKFLCEKSYLEPVNPSASFDSIIYSVTEEGKKALNFTYLYKTCEECKKRPVVTYRFKMSRLCNECLNKDEEVNLEDHVYNSDKGYNSSLHTEGFSPSRHEEVRIYSNLSNIKNR